MAEKDIVTAILRYLGTIPGCFCFKEHGGMYGTAGIPDIIACIGGRFVAFEVKTPSGKLTKLQEKTLQKIIEAGGNACKVTCLAEAKTIVNGIIRLENEEDLAL
ncbi:VRR-NUC domain-containing protein [Acetanaerobacterium elongatum]|uniref:Holliday junction resolvase (Hjc) n=1 Tax=Acetanaerobacterium elongatum TaxID=258515 RepID=A0A1G9YD51_9FIRM|nr:VRR-NUC domain-containing protein [Acetanaerobacterium elongatum]SDN06994.1 holliday junction resolvase (hjc) [Acetanaerobacterium elongatum]